MTCYENPVFSPVEYQRPQPTRAQVQQEHAAAMAMRDAFRQVAASQIVQITTDAMLAAGWTPDVIRCFGELIAIRAGEIGANHSGTNNV